MPLIHVPLVSIKRFRPQTLHEAMQPVSSSSSSSPALATVEESLHLETHRPQYAASHMCLFPHNVAAFRNPRASDPSVFEVYQEHRDLGKYSEEKRNPFGMVFPPLVSMGNHMIQSDVFESEFMKQAAWRLYVTRFEKSYYVPLDPGVSTPTRSSSPAHFATYSLSHPYQVVVEQDRQEVRIYRRGHPEPTSFQRIRSWWILDVACYRKGFLLTLRSKRTDSASTRMQPAAILYEMRFYPYTSDLTPSSILVQTQWTDCPSSWIVLYGRLSERTQTPLLYTTMRDSSDSTITYSALNQTVSLSWTMPLDGEDPTRALLHEPTLPSTVFAAMADSFQPLQQEWATRVQRYFRECMMEYHRHPLQFPVCAFVTFRLFEELVWVWRQTTKDVSVKRACVHFDLNSEHWATFLWNTFSLKSTMLSPLYLQGILYSATIGSLGHDVPRSVYRHVFLDQKGLE